jgi:hypothetical protein
MDQLFFLDSQNQYLPLDLVISILSKRTDWVTQV